ncbi:MAG: adenylate/guanylate cyclase domain-containing protein [Calothrix sp. MO_192.B10]|nr:adenylate/guanylate cyclase domain-containing protein [Calothrix sp. MO_192.B10]
MTELQLRLKDGNTFKTVTVDREVFTIGRLPECDLSLPFAGVSRCHARLVNISEGVWTIEDLGSKNGTQVNDRLINYPQELQHGDILWLGDAKLVVQLKLPELPWEGKQEENNGQKTILRNVKQLQQQWIEVDPQEGNSSNRDVIIARLKDLVDIAKNLSGATSIEEIFFQVETVVFRYLNGIERLALLIDISGNGNLEVVNSAAKTLSQQQYLADDSDWISRTICQRVFKEKVAIQTADAQNDERFAGEQSILFKGIRSAMAVPLWDENKVVGVLYADARLFASHWVVEGKEELSFFSTLANLVASSVQRWMLAEKLKTEELIRHRLERYHSPAVVQQLIAVGSKLPDGRLPPQEKEISILFADIVGFTAISERFTPSQIAELLNNLFEEMLQEIFTYGGTLDKYIGDCIMAFFGAPEPQADHAERAVNAAKGMLSRLQTLNHNGFWQEPLQLRIAINSGKAVVGDVGSSQRVDYTALGATINLASRMEGICPPSECVIGEDTYRLLSQPDDFQEMGYYRFKGINRPVCVYRTHLSN